MRHLLLIGCIGFKLAGLAIGNRAHAATAQTIGSGSAVSSIDRLATFDSLTSTNTTELGNYTEGALRVSTGSQNWGADPPMSASLDPFQGFGGPDRAFFAMANGTSDWVAIRTTNRARMYAVEFLYGNTWTTGDSSRPWGNNNAFVEWQTLYRGTLISSGQIGQNSVLPVGTVVGFYDPAGFDELLLKCRIANSADPNLQALALDNVYAQLNNTPPAPVIYASDFVLDPTSGVPSLTVYGTLPVCQYRMLYSESLTNPTPAWTPVGSALPGADVLTFTDPGAVGRPHRFYRVEAR